MNEEEREQLQEYRDLYKWHKERIEANEGWLKKFYTIPDVEGTRHLDIGWGEAEAPILGASMGVDLPYNEGFEISANEQKIKTAYLKEINFEQLTAEGENLPLADGTIDSVSSQFSMGDWWDLYEGLTEAIRVLRSGGKLQIVTSQLTKDIRVIRDWLKQQPVKNVKITKLEKDEHNSGIYGIEFTKI